MSVASGGSKVAPKPGVPARPGAPGAAASGSRVDRKLLKQAIEARKKNAKPLKLEKKDAERYLRFAAFTKAKDYPGSEAAADVAVRCDATLFDGWVLLGAARAKQKSYLEAVPCYRHALELKPDDVACWAAVGELYIALEQFKRAAEALKRACRARSESGASERPTRPRADRQDHRHATALDDPAPRLWRAMFDV